MPGQSWKQFWDDFEKHSAKWYYFKRETMTKDVRGLTEKDRRRLLGEGAKQDSKFREIALYTDYGMDVGWRIPSKLPLEDQLEHCILLGEHMLSAVERSSRERKH